MTRPTPIPATVYEAALRTITREPIIGDDVLLRRWCGENMDGGAERYMLREIALDVIRLAADPMVGRAQVCIG